MSQANPQMRHFAKRLIVFEAKERESNQPSLPVAFGVCEKLRPQLATLMGTGGFHALQARALALARPEVPWLRAVSVNADGSLEEVRMQLKPDELLEGRIVLLAHLLGLLCSFIGESLTWRLVRETWPKIPLPDLDSSDAGGK